MKPNSASFNVSSSPLLSTTAIAGLQYTSIKTAINVKIINCTLNTTNKINRSTAVENNNY